MRILTARNINRHRIERGKKEHPTAKLFTSINLQQEMNAQISNNRITKALQLLQSHNRGLNALADFKKLARGMASGLDSAGMDALVVLTQEFANGKRDFLQLISSVVLPPISREKNS